MQKKKPPRQTRAERHLVDKVLTPIVRRVTQQKRPRPRRSQSKRHRS